MVSAKTSLIIGGDGALGRAMVNVFRQGGWSVVNVAPNHNNEASANVLVDAKQPMKTQVSDIAHQVGKHSKSYDSILCVAGGFSCSSIKDESIFETYDMEDQRNFQTALLSGHLATQVLAPQGLLMLTGAAAVFEGPVNFAYAYALSKAQTHALALQLAERSEIPATSTVCTILPQVIDTPANRESMPDADFSTWAPPAKIATMVRSWANGDNRPMNGSFAKIEYKNDSVYATFV